MVPVPHAYDIVVTTNIGLSARLELVPVSKRYERSSPGGAPGRSDHHCR